MSDMTPSYVQMQPDGAGKKSASHLDGAGSHVADVMPVALDGTPLGTILAGLTKPADQQHVIIDSSAAIGITNANLDAKLSDIKAKTDNLDVLLSTRTKPADSQTVTGTIAVTNANLDAKLSDIKAKTDNLDVALSTRTKSADQQHGIIDSDSSVRNVYNNPALVATRMTTELDGLTNGSGAIASAAFDNSAAAARWKTGDFELYFTSTAPTVGNLVDLYILPTIDGTNYPIYGSVPVNCFVGSFVVQAATTNRLVLLGVRLPPTPFKCYLVNNSGQSFGSSGNTLKLVTSRDQLAA